MITAKQSLVLVAVLALGFAGGWIARSMYAPAVHVVIDQMPVLSGIEEQSKKPLPPICGTPEENLTAASCYALGRRDAKSGKIVYPKDCAQVIAKIEACKAQSRKERP